MLNIVSAHPLPFIIALLIGIATAWWIWARRPEDEADAEFDYHNEYAREPVLPYQVDAEPEPEGVPAPDPVPVPEPAPAPAPVPSPAPVVAADVSAAAVSAQADTPQPMPTPEGPKPDIAAAVGAPDDLKRVKGIGPKLEALCHSIGVLRFDQIAEWTSRDVAAVDQHLGSFKGRITRDQWVAQAKLLAAGKVTEHTTIYGA